MKNNSKNVKVYQIKHLFELMGQYGVLGDLQLTEVYNIKQYFLKQKLYFNIFSDRGCHAEYC